MRWHNIDRDPNSDAVLEYRREQLAAVWMDHIPRREAYVTSRVAGKKVLDLGCVEHDSSYMERDWWLHKYIVSASYECVGADIDAVGIEAMQRAGYKAVVLDINDGYDVVSNEIPFDVVVAGELIEHLPAPQVLFEFARDVLRPNGELVITTPNPFAPHRVRAGQLAVTWENVDHVLFAFPAGIAEMADRAGLVLTAAGTAEPAWRPGFESSRPYWDAFWTSTREWLTAQRSRQSLPEVWQSPIDILIARLVRRSAMIGETGIYVVTKLA